MKNRSSFDLNPFAISVVFTLEAAGPEEVDAILSNHVQYEREIFLVVVQEYESVFGAPHEMLDSVRSNFPSIDHKANPRVRVSEGSIDVEIAFFIGDVINGISQFGSLAGGVVALYTIGKLLLRFSEKAVLKALASYANVMLVESEYHVGEVMQALAQYGDDEVSFAEASSRIIRAVSHYEDDIEMERLMRAIEVYCEREERRRLARQPEGNSELD